MKRLGRLAARLCLTALAAGLLASAAVPAGAQDEPVDIAADRLIGSRNAQGEVVFLQGNVELRRGTTVVRSQEGRWAKSLGTVTLLGGVTAIDGTLRITADQADYQESTDLIVLTGNVHVTDRDLEAVSSFGSYDSQTRRAEMWGGVNGSERGRRLKADRVTYERDTQLAEAVGRVWAADSSGTLELEADRVRFERALELARAVGAPRLVRNDKGKRTVLTGDTLTVDTRRKIAWADGNVHIERDTLEARSAHAVYWDDEDRGLLTGVPVAKNREVEATGDTIEVFTRDTEIQRASVRGQGRIEFRSRTAETLGETNTLTAPRIEVYFGGGKVDSLQALGGAENLYLAPPKEGRLPERNLARGQSVTVYFGEDRIDRAVLTGKPSGEYRFELAVADSARGPEETITYQGARIEYQVQERKIHIRDGAQLRYQNLQLGAGRVDFDSRQETLVARDRPVLKDRDEELTGRTMTYDLESGRGTVYHAATQYDRGYYRGAAIAREPDNVLQVRTASYSTCDLAEPHFHVSASRMKIMLRDKIIARPLVFYLKNIPLLAFPFYVLPIKPDRHSGLLFPQLQIGFSPQDGRFIRNLGYYWAPSDYMDLTVSGDYYEKEPSWIARGEGRYRYLDRVYGQIDGRFTNSEALYASRQYDINLTHNQTLDPATRLTAEGHFTSSRDFTRDPRTGQPLANRVDRFLVSTLGLNRRLPFGTLNAYLSRREDLDTDPVASPLPRLTEDLPTLSLAVFQRTIGRAASGGRAAFLPALSTVYYNFNVRAVNRREARTVFTPEWDTTLVNGVPVAERGTRDSSSTLSVMATQGGLSDSRRLFGFLNVSPNVNAAAALYSEDLLGNPWQPAGVYNLGIGTSTTFYGAFHPRVAGLSGIRHILFPQISYSYQPDFPGLTYRDTLGNLRNRFPTVGGVTLSGFRSSLLNYSLQQRLQVRLRRAGSTIDLPNLFTVVTGGSYDFLWRERGYPTPWRPISTTFRLQPPRFVTVNGTLTHSLDAKPYFRTFTCFVDFRLSGAAGTLPVGELPLDGNEALARGDDFGTGPWNFSLTYSYTSGRNSLGGWNTSRSANSFVSFSPTPKWHLTYYNTIDLDNRKIQAEEYAVERDLHCWRARFVRRFTADNESEYFFRIAIVQQPEVNIGLGSRGLGSFSGF